MRNKGIDLIRIIGIIAVVAGHVWDNELSRKLLYTWHVPIFFFLSGYFWKSDRSLKKDLVNRWASLVRPYLCWLVVLGMLFVVIEYSRDDLTLRDGVGMILGGSYLTRPFSAFWFVTALIIGSLFFRALQKVPTWIGLIFAGLGLIAAYVAPEQVSAIPYAVGTAVPSLIFIYAGKSFRTFRPQNGSWFLGVLLLLFGFSAALTGLIAPLDMKSSDFGTPIASVLFAIIVCAGFTLCGDWIGNYFNETTSHVVSELEATGFMVVLTHAAILYVLDTPDNRGFPDFYLAIVIPWGAAILLHRTRMSEWTLGRTRQLPIRK